MSLALQIKNRLHSLPLVTQTKRAAPPWKASLKLPQRFPCFLSLNISKSYALNNTFIFFCHSCTMLVPDSYDGTYFHFLVWPFVRIVPKSDKPDSHSLVQSVLFRFCPWLYWGKSGLCVVTKSWNLHPTVNVFWRTGVEVNLQHFLPLIRSHQFLSESFCLLTVLLC